MSACKSDKCKYVHAKLHPQQVMLAIMGRKADKHTKGHPKSEYLQHQSFHTTPRFTFSVEIDVSHAEVLPSRHRSAQQLCLHNHDMCNIPPTHPLTTALPGTFEDWLDNPFVTQLVETLDMHAMRVNSKANGNVHHDPKWVSGFCQQVLHASTHSTIHSLTHLFARWRGLCVCLYHHSKPKWDWEINIDICLDAVMRWCVALFSTFRTFAFCCLFLCLVFHETSRCIALQNNTICILLTFSFYIPVPLARKHALLIISSTPYCRTWYGLLAEGIMVGRTKGGNQSIRSCRSLTQSYLLTLAHLFV